MILLFLFQKLTFQLLPYIYIGIKLSMFLCLYGVCCFDPVKYSVYDDQNSNRNRNQNPNECCIFQYVQFNEVVYIIIQIEKKKDLNCGE